MSKKKRRKPAKTRSAGNPAPTAPVTRRNTDWHETVSELATAQLASPDVGPGLAERPQAATVAAIGPPVGGLAASGGAEADPASRGITATAQVTTAGCAEILDHAEPQVVAATYWFDAAAAAHNASHDAPYTLAIRFIGVRTGLVGKAEPRDRFERIERVEGLTAGSGRVAITARVDGVNPGSWRVTVTPIVQPRGPTSAKRPGSTGGQLSPQVRNVRTRFGVFAQGPGVRLRSWPTLVGLGATVAIALQAVLLARTHVEVATTTGISLVASLLGFVGAKVWYLVLHRQHPRALLTAGACIQGFLVGCFGALALATLIVHIPAGTYLDATTPGLFFGMAVGRPGCFLTGCCTGRPTTSRWGLWSSDRRLAIRRFPVQLVEAVLALAIGAATLALVLTIAPPINGAIFVGAVTVYTFGRQLLFPARADSRTPRGRSLTMGLCGLVLLADLAVSTLA